MDVGKNTSLGDGDVTKELIQFFVISDGELKVARDDTCFLVVTSCVAGKLEDFGSQIFKDSSKIDWGTCFPALAD